MSPARHSWPSSTRALAICSQIALGLGCAGSPAAEHPRATVAPTPSASSRPAAAPRPPRVLTDADWGWLQASTFSIELPVPERGAWRVADGAGRWFTAEHAGSGDQLQVRAWSARRTVSRSECEQELYLGRPELRRGAEGALLEERRLSVPEGFDVWLRAWAESADAGTALAVGAGPGRCYAAVFHARGDEAEIGRALRLAVDGIFEHVRLRDVDETRGVRAVPAF